MLRRTLSFSAVSALLVLSSCSTGRTDSAGEPTSSSAVPLARDVRDALTPDEVFAQLKAGNQRFVNGTPLERHVPTFVETTSKGQYPKAVVLSCLDSRVPPELVFDQGIGDMFVGRVAGNFENTDLLGSFEFATKAAGARLIVVLGQTACGALYGAADGVELGNLTATLDNLEPAPQRAQEEVGGQMSSRNQALMAAATDINVRMTMQDIVERSPVIAELVAAGQVAVVGGVYDLATGKVRWLEG